MVKAQEDLQYFSSLHDLLQIVESYFAFSILFVSSARVLWLQLDLKGVTMLIWKQQVHLACLPVIMFGLNPFAVCVCVCSHVQVHQKLGPLQYVSVYLGSSWMFTGFPHPGLPQTGWKVLCKEQRRGGRYLKLLDVLQQDQREWYSRYSTIGMNAWQRIPTWFQGCNHILREVHRV